MTEQQKTWEKKIFNKNWKCYQETLKNNENTWDYIVITASNKEQEEEYKKEIKYRQENNFLPQKTKIIVITDYQEKRVGSGGATLTALLHIKETEKEYNKLKILIINSGGDSKRIAQYSVTGKIFIPIQKILPDGRISSLFDEIFIAVAGIPLQMEPGALILTGDILLTFDYSKIQLNEKVMALSAKADSKTGEEHGVFFTDKKNNLIEFLHKKKIKILKDYRSY